MKLRSVAARASGQRLSSTGGYYDYDTLFTRNHLELPQLPIPSLDQVAADCILSARGIQDKNDLAPLVKDFTETTGSKLYAEVLAREAARDPTVWPFTFVEQAWKDMYASDRTFTPVWTNPGYMVVDNPARTTQAGRAADFVTGLLRFHRKLHAGDLEGQQACLSFMTRQFGFGRVPTEGKDTYVHDHNSRHIAVLCKGNIYTLTVLDASGNQMSRVQLEEKFKHIMENSTPPTYTVCSGTGVARDDWTALRSKIQHNNHNVELFSKVDTALWVVALESENCADSQAYSQAILHGDGTNRWYDKHMAIVFPNGRLGFNFEHSLSDGAVWNRMLREVMADADGWDSGFTTLPVGSDFTLESSPELLNWSVDSEDQATLQDMAREYNVNVAKCHTTHLSFDGFGSKAIKELQVSPDAFMQMLYQAAYQTIHREAPGTYEACSMGRYWHGRTETIRSRTVEAANFVERLLEGGAEARPQALALRAACDQHVQVVKSALRGDGIDRILFMMKNVARETGQWHALFDDPLFQRSSKWVVSTSNGSEPWIDVFNFGAVVPDGYGFGYIISEDRVSLNVTNWDLGGGTDSQRMREVLLMRLDDMRKVLRAVPKGH